MAYLFERHLDDLLSKARLPGQPPTPRSAEAIALSLHQVCHEHGAKIAKLFFTPAELRESRVMALGKGAISSRLADIALRDWRAVCRAYPSIPPVPEAVAATIATLRQLGCIDRFEIMREERYRRSLLKALTRAASPNPSIPKELGATLHEDISILKLATRRHLETSVPRSRRQYSAADKRLLRQLLKDSSLWKRNYRGAPVPRWEILTQRFNAETNRACSMEAIRIITLRRVLNARERSAIVAASTKARRRRGAKIATLTRLYEKYPDRFEKPPSNQTRLSRSEVAHVSNILRGAKPFSTKEAEALKGFVNDQRFLRANGAINWIEVARAMKRAVGFSRSRGSYRQFLTRSANQAEIEVQTR